MSIIVFKVWKISFFKLLRPKIASKNVKWIVSQSKVKEKTSEANLCLRSQFSYYKGLLL